MPQHSRSLSWLAAAVFATSLAACGGDGDDAPVASTPAPAPTPGVPGDPTPGQPAVVTGQYRLESTPATAAGGLSALNAMGQLGYAYVTGVAEYRTTLPVPMGDLYLTDTAHTGSKLQYSLATPATTVADLGTQLNQQGAAGALYKGELGFGTGLSVEIRSLFVKDTTKTTTFTYEVKPTTTTQQKATLLAELNAQGARGFRYQSTGVLTPSLAAFNLYVKDSAPAATYTYTFVDSTATGPASGAALKTQLNAQGANGNVLLGTYSVNDLNTFVQIYEKSSLQTKPVTYDVVAVDTSDTLAQMTVKANTRAAAGEFLYGDVMTSDQKFNTIYVKGALSNRHPLAGPVFP
jgi:hypothetical protein